MVRRRSTKAKQAQSKPRGVQRRDSKMKRWDKLSEIPLEEEDQFHAARDQIMLNGDEEGGSDDGDEDEVFALKGVQEDESDEDDDEEGEDDEIDDVHMAGAAAQKKAREKEKKKRGKKGKKAKESESEEEDSDEDEGWGTKKSAYYSSNAAQIESDDEEANELEEQEAKRLQAKARAAMADDDFGLGDMVDGGQELDEVSEEPAPVVVQKLPQDKRSLLRHLEKTNPEALALANDWDDIAHQLIRTQQKIEKIESLAPDGLSLGLSHLHYQALLTYATTLAFYLHLRSSAKYAQRPDLLTSHPILARLFTLKQALATLEELDFAASDDDEDDDESDLDSNPDDPLTAEERRMLTALKSRAVERSEIDDLLREAESIIHGGSDAESDTTPTTNAKDPKPKSTSKRKTKPEDPAAAAPPKKKRKASAAAATPVFDLVEPDLAPSKPSKSKLKPKTPTAEAAPDMYGEATSLDAADAQDKRARKKSLRFHVARIESTSSRRAGARAGALGGDDDIPYRERRKEREARLAREVANARGGGADLDDAEPELELGEKAGRKRGREEVEDEEAGEADGYFALVKRKSKEAKEQKKREHDAVVAAARQFEEEGVDGPRSLTRAILKNKGLTPHRSKSVRNPRVKKRQKYEQAKKKVASQRAVYKGGVGASGKYEGEKTGISLVVKSVRLG